METTLHQGKLYAKKYVLCSLYFYGPIIYLFSQVVDGPLRLSLQTIGLELLLYSRDFIPILIVVVAICHAVLTDRINKLLFTVMLALLLYGFVGMIHIPNIFQVLYGLKILLPFLMGVISYSSFFNDTRRIKKFFAMFFITACIGMYINYFVEFPWQGLTYQAGGIEIEGTLERETLGFSRLTGFARANFFAAEQILLTAIFLVIFSKSNFMRLIIWLTAGGAIILTTTKTAIGCYLLISLFFLIYKVAGNRFRIFQKMLIIPLFFMIALPLYENSGVIAWISTDIEVESLLGSFEDRILNAWPPAFKHVRDNGNPITGMGIGGAGAAEQRFGSEYHGPTDNMFVYLYTWFGVMSIFSLTIAYLMSQRLDIDRNNMDLCIYIWLTATFLSGITGSMVESPFYGFIIGIILKHFYTLSSATTGSMR